MCQAPSFLAVYLTAPRGQTQPTGFAATDNSGATSAPIAGGRRASASIAVSLPEQLSISKGSGGAWSSLETGSTGLRKLQADECPPCETMFGKLNGAQQHVELQLRGEPKSGTSFMFEWAVNALMVTCEELGRLYGEGTCTFRWRGFFSRRKQKPVSPETALVDMKEVFFVFKPNRQHGRSSAGGPSASPCPCSTVDKVSIMVSSLFKHDLPVPPSCPWQHVDNVTPENKGCTTVNGRRVGNYTDTVECLQQHPCRIVDDRIQMLILRDPRAVAVSSFFHLKTHHHPFWKHLTDESVDSFVLRMLPTICHFIHLRYLVLHEKLGGKTVEFTYDESLADPLQWHQRWLSSVGLTPPPGVVLQATNTSLRREYGFAGKGVDKHPGGKEATEKRTWEDEISHDVAEQLEGICREWLPPVLLEKFGIGAPP
ncbi:hypothetical protein Esi_0254_0001 [Ectocarpus siliculosus]|uniref:Sulfotransferase domain-containing protein n=1 Tax=Ectocarpus siliculosus TaxID=2880 RepID=D8LJE4_ECTSI|nr:hypothetical protein Esi_0254_0001 [Ectocarpus siliculosus]|eukprot:CBN79477.1 hypothetical protein Esi_0254_0001 [Ectocarpus siliculosus]